MALETLVHNQQEATKLMGISYGDVADIQEPRIVMDGTIEVEGEDVHVFRAHSGPEHNADGDSLIGKGGIRMARYSPEEAEATAKELSVEMLAKLALRGQNDTYRGAKGLIVVDARAIDHAAKDHAARQYEHRMEGAGLAGYNRDVPAGDVGTNGLSDAYALEYRDRTGDPRWKAAITGKSPANGGLDFRTKATGWGGYVSQKTIMDAYGHDRVQTAVQGFGNVGAWHAHFASNDPENRIAINAISDVGGTLATEDPAGINVTREMVEEIGDNPYFEGNKVQPLQAAVAKNQPGLKTEVRDSGDVISYPTDYFVPAAMGNVITRRNVETLGARLAIVQDANGPVKPYAHQRLTEKGIINLPDIVANGAGVDCSIKEHHANIAGIALATEQVQRELTQTSERVVRDVLAAAEHLQIKDLGVAAAAVSIGHLLRQSSPGLLAELISA